MTNEHIKALDTLIAAAESGSIMSMDARSVCHCLGWKFPDMRTKWLLSAEIGSLDAAKDLHEALLPGVMWQRSPNGQFCLFDSFAEEVSYATETDNPARAWLIAILKAYRSITEDS